MEKQLFVDTYVGLLRSFSNRGSAVLERPAFQLGTTKWIDSWHRHFYRGQRVIVLGTAFEVQSAGEKILRLKIIEENKENVLDFKKKL